MAEICYRCGSSEVEELTVIAADVKADMERAGYDVSGISDKEIIPFTFCNVCSFSRIPLLLKLNKREGSAPPQRVICETQITPLQSA